MKPLIERPSVAALSKIEDAGSTVKSHRLPWILAAVLLAVFFALGNLPLVRGKQAPIWDAESFFAPAFTLIADHARAGRLVLWNPWQGGGSPDYAEPELANQSPIAVGVGAIIGGTVGGFRAYWLLIWFLGGLGMLGLARQLGASACAAFAVSTAFLFCGFYTAHAEHTSSICCFSFLPWLVWRFDASIFSGSRLQAAQAGALWGLSALGGYPQLVILSGGFVLLWAVGRWFFGGTAPPTADLRLSNSRRWRFRTEILIIFAVVGLAILSPAYVSFFYEGGTGYSDRVGPRSRAESVSSNLIQPHALATFSSPYLTDLKFFDPTLWPHSDTSVTNVYVGAMITIFAVVSLINRPRDKWRWWMWALAVFFLTCSVGNYLPIRGWLYDFFIPTRYFRNPALFRAYSMFLASVLALTTMKDLEQARFTTERLPWVKLMITSIVVSATAYAAYFHVIRTVSNTGTHLHLANIHMMCAWLGCVVLSIGLIFVPKFRNMFPLLVALAAVVDGSLTIALARMTVSSAGHSRLVWTHLDDAHNPNLVLTSNGLRRELRPPTWIGAVRTNANVSLKVPTFINYATMTNSFQMAFARHDVLKDMSIGDDRIWFSSEVVTGPPSDRFFEAFVERSEHLKMPVLVVHPPEQMRDIRHRSTTSLADENAAHLVEQSASAQRLRYKLVRYTPNHLDFSISAPSDGWVLVTDRWCRGWRAKVNGHFATIFGGNFIYRAVQVRAGPNLIEFTYSPAGWPTLLLLSWGMLTGVLVIPQLSPARMRRCANMLSVSAMRLSQLLTLTAMVPAKLKRWRIFEAVSASAESASALSWLASAGFLLLVFVIGNFKLVIGAEALPWDASGFFAPAFTLVADHARAGRIMLWNPWISGGSPDYAEPELGGISPVAILVGAISGGTEAGFRLYYLIVWLLGPLGLLMLARHLRAPPWAAVVVALGLMYCGFYTGHAQHTSSVYSYSWLPLLVWRIDVAVLERRVWPALQAGALWGLSALGGYPELVILSGTFAFLWAVGRVVLAHSGEEQDRILYAPGGRFDSRIALLTKTSASFILAGAMVLAAPYAAFFAEGHGFADRVGVRSRQEAIESMRLPVGALSTFSSPYLVKLKYFNSGRPWPETDGTMESIYAGALIPMLALLGLLGGLRSSFRWWLFGVVIFYLACALGNQLPLRAWLYDYVYPTRYFRNAALFRQYAIFAASVLALFCSRDLQRAICHAQEIYWRRAVICVTFVSGVAALTYTYVFSLVRYHGDLFERANLHFVLVWAAAPLVVTCALFNSTARSRLPVLFLIIASVDALFTISIVNGGAFHFVSAGGAGRYWWNRINDDHKSSLDLTPHGFTRKLRNDDFSNRPNNRNVPLKDATFENYETMWNRFELDMWAHPALLGMFTGDNRLWFTKQALQVIPTDKFYKEFVRRSVDVSAPILLVHAPADMAKIRERDVMTQDDNRLVAQIEKLPGSQAVPAKLLRYTPNHLDFEVTCPESGWLLITDRWAHGWRVKLNGSAAKVFGGDFIFRAVQVHAGTNTIQFSYLPFGFPGLFILSWSALVCIFLGPVIKRRIENLQRRSAGSDSLIEPVRASASQIRPN